LNAGAKAMAGTAIDMLTKPDDLQKVKEEFAVQLKEHPYQSFLPEDAQPPLDINEELMNKFRPLMENFSIEE
jgi:aminobenzoyl-glutamate utilization protein B